MIFKIKLDEELINRLSQLLNDHDLTEIEIKDGRKSIKVSKGAKASIISYEGQEKNKKIKNELENSKSERNNYNNHPGAIRAPMVGTLYHSSSPDAKAFIEIGKKVKKGDIIFIIEAMKTMNQVKSDKTGEVKEILVKNEAPVEFNDILAIIE